MLRRTCLTGHTRALVTTQKHTFFAESNKKKPTGGDKLTCECADAAGPDRAAERRPARLIPHSERFRYFFESVQASNDSGK